MVVGKPSHDWSYSALVTCAENPVELFDVHLTLFSIRDGFSPKERHAIPISLKGLLLPSIFIIITNMTNGLSSSTPTKKGGKPKKFATPEDFWAAAERYFELCDTAVDATKKDPKTGEPLPAPKQYTLTGLALGLGFSSLKELYAYSDYEEFQEVAECARLKVQNAYEANLQKAACVGSIFALKNMGWRDERHVETNNKGNNRDAPLVNIDFTKINTDAMAQIFNAMKEVEK